MAKKYFLEASSKTLHGSFNHEYDPIISIRSGDSVQLNTPDIGWGFNSQNGERIQFESRVKEANWGHPVLGPIAIEEAKAGMTLEVKINDIVPSWYGWNCAGGRSNWHNKTLGIDNETELKLDWLLNNQTMVGQTKIDTRTFSVSLQPFMGLLGNAPIEKGTHSTIPPRNCGGNIDCKELVKGSSLFLPIMVDKALFSVGDGHAAQGDGEVSGQAIECPMDIVDLTFVVHNNLQLNIPRAKTPSGWLTFGFHEDLNEATSQALNGMIDLIQEMYQISRREASALASVVVDLRITQVVNQVKGVHAVLPNGAIR